MARIFACETQTPLGLEVEPDVYCKNAGASAAIAGGVQWVGGSPGRASVASSSQRAASGSPLASERSRGSILLSVFYTPMHLTSPHWFLT